MQLRLHPPRALKRLRLACAGRRAKSLEALMPLLHLSGISSAISGRSLLACSARRRPTSPRRSRASGASGGTNIGDGGSAIRRRYVCVFADGVDFAGVRGAASRKRVGTDGATGEARRSRSAFKRACGRAGKGWNDMLVDFRAGKLVAAPQAAVGDGAL
jgi:hypothetical protein